MELRQRLSRGVHVRTPTSARSSRLSGEVRGIFVRCVSEAQVAPADRK